MRIYLFLVYFFFIVLSLFLIPSRSETCEKGDSRSHRYLLYDVNPGEGFNLRRDVFVRIANLARRLSEMDNWILVLPPWGRLYHWKHTHRGEYFPWHSFFDIKSLSKWTPVIEFEDYLKAEGPKIQEVYMLQHYVEGWTGEWVVKYDRRPCLEEHNFREDSDGSWHGTAWGTNIRVGNFSCLSIQGEASTLIPLITQKDETRTVLITRAETVLHDEYGGRRYWAARRSMRFAKHLLSEAARFRAEYLHSDDVSDKTEVTDDWRDFKPKHGTAVGGPYLSVHLRRRDFIYARGDEIPSLKKAAKQMKELLQAKELQDVYIATDAPLEEYVELEELMKPYNVHRYDPSPEFFDQWGDGGVAIIDQIICAHARYFTGSYESTFSFRIQEEREIMGFPVETTFNRLCGKKAKCEQPAKWKIVY
ncbi:GDP-fucose protein O-fucosyltransferase 2-like [Penaeus monodon]|uniref:GDP-fucose protein O-fucosyltransferase 2-like n=1 Tax=Penaeus monodon TaxID=6687 RepID=UPI0018A7DF1C|nr:GDP-fucose protein O-fucosyltransferase 2-like [Penaeus monodon]XP_037775794.1 GDP-fucose protein O-fucosyltransferase 2-like [Penaeus monodon]